MDLFSIGAMDAGLWIQYIAIFFVLVAMEGLLSADNALVLAVMVRPLSPKLRSKALFYGLIGAVVLRFTALFFVSFLANVWQAQAAGALYLIYVGTHNLYKYMKEKKEGGEGEARENLPTGEPEHYLHSRKDFWITVAKVEFTDIAFAVDSILAAVAIAISLPPTGWGHIGGMDAGEFILVLCGGLCGVVLMRFAATIFRQAPRQTAKARGRCLSPRHLGRHQARRRHPRPRSHRRAASRISGKHPLACHLLWRDDPHRPLGLVLVQAG